MGAFSSSISFDPSKDIPSLAGKVILVTGGNSGLGEACVAAYALHKPAKIYLAARSGKRAAEAISRITATLPDPSYASCIEVIELDLASLSSVKTAGEKLLKLTDRIDIVQLNGGIGASMPSKTADGYEAHFGTNFLGHAALVQVLMPVFEKTAALPDVDDVRLVWISSIAHRVFSPPEGIPFGKLRTDFSQEHGMAGYGTATLAKVLFAGQMSKRFGDGGIHATSVHPGTVKTNIWNGEKGASWLLQQAFKVVVFLTGVTSEEGAKTQLWASVSKDAKNGIYYEPIGKTSGAGKYAYDEDLGEKLWEWTAEHLKLHGFPGW